MHGEADASSPHAQHTSIGCRTAEPVAGFMRWLFPLKVALMQGLPSERDAEHRLSKRNETKGTCSCPCSCNRAIEEPVLCLPSPLASIMSGHTYVQCWQIFSSTRVCDGFPRNVTGGGCDPTILLNLPHLSTTIQSIQHIYTPVCPSLCTTLH